MLQNLITDLVCVNCDANLMRDLAEGGALFDTAKGNLGTTSNLPTGFDCLGVTYDGFSGSPLPHIARRRDGAPADSPKGKCLRTVFKRFLHETTAVCKECEMTITWNADLTDWESADERSCRQVGSTINAFYQQHEPA